MELPIPDDWDGQSTCYYAVCWPDSVKWRAVLSGLVEMPMQGRFWDFSTGHFLSLRGQFRPIFDTNFNLRGCILACNDDQFNELIGAINNIGAGLSASAGDCGCPGGTDRPSGPGVEGDPPPLDFEDTGDEPGSPEYQNRKCVISNLIHKFAIDATTALNVASVDEILSAILSGGIGLATAYIISLLTALTFAWVLAIIGVAALIVETIVSSSIDLDNLITILNDNDEEFVCALYNATDTSTARADYLQVLSDNGGTLGQAAFVSAIFLLDDVLNSLFFEPLPGDRRAALQSAIDNYGGGVDCGLCGDLIWAVNALICEATQVSGMFNDGEPVELTSCVGSFFGTSRAGIVSGALPVETDERSVGISAVTGGGNFYVVWRENGIDQAESISAAGLSSRTYTCSQLQISRLDANDTTPFGLTMTANLIP